MRGLAGAVLCETGDLGIKWLHWHTLVFFSDEIKIDMRYVCPRDVKNWYREPDQCIGRSGQQSTNRKS